MLRGYSWRNVIDAPEKFFVVVATIFGMLFVFLTPPLQGPDEQAHFAQVYRYSEGIVSPTSDLPRGVINTYKTVFYEDDIRFMGNEKYEIGRTKHALLKIPLDQDVRVDGAPYGGTVYSPLVYLPQIIAVFIGRILEFPAIVLLYLGRLASAATLIYLLFISIRLFPVAKWPAAVIGLLPMSVFSGSVVSSDAITIGASALFIALIVRTVTMKQLLTTRYIVFLVLATILVSMTKLVSIILLPLLLLLVFKKNGSLQRNKLLLVSISIMVLGVIAAFTWQFIAPATSEGVNSNIPQNVVPNEQIKLIIQSPQKFLYALWNTYFHAWGDGIYYSLIGTFGWADTPMAIAFIILGYTALALVLLSNRGADAKILGKLGKLPKIGLVSVIMLYVTGVNAAMFIFYSPVDYNIIVGLQGRYFIPVLFLLAVVSINRDQLMIKSRSYKLLVTVVPVFLLAVSAMYVFIRYYMETRI